MIRKYLIWQTLGLVILFVTTVAAQTSPQDPDGDTYRVWYEANAANDLPKAYELGKRYLREFPRGKYSAYLNKWLPNARAKLFNTAVSAKDTDALLSLGNEALANEPDNLNYLITLAQHLSTNELYASPPNYTHAAEAESYTRRAIKLIEAGKQPANSANWDRNQSLTYFYQVVAGIEERNNNLDSAVIYFDKATKTDPANALPFFRSGRIYQQKYAAAAERYRAIPEAEKNAAVPRSEVQALLKEVNGSADAMIDRWVKFLKLTSTNNTFGATRDKVEQAVAELYKYRHPESPDGYQELIKP